MKLEKKSSRKRMKSNKNHNNNLVWDLNLGFLAKLGKCTQCCIIPPNLFDCYGVFALNCKVRRLKEGQKEVLQLSYPSVQMTTDN